MIDSKMTLSDKLPKPVKKLKQIRDQREEKNHKKLFYEEQFQKMVKNGNYKKAVELIWDEARNLNIRVNNEIKAGDLAQYCYKRLYHSEEDVVEVRKCLEELESDYELGIEDEN